VILHIALVGTRVTLDMLGGYAVLDDNLACLFLG
jgi:hypothetical protein